MNYATIKETDIADGPGVRTTLYVSGCQLALEGHPCKGCHNFEAWKKDYGQKFTKETEQLIINYLKPDYIKGFSLLGGEPLSDFNIPDEYKLIKEIKRIYPDKDIWMWTGYNLNKWFKKHKYNKFVSDGCLANYKDFFKYIDVVVDGPYIESLRDPTLKFMGSSNQRILTRKELDKILC